MASAPPGFWLQLGAFRERDGAFDFQRKVERDVDWLAPMMSVFADRELYRLQAGPYASRVDASGAAESLRAALRDGSDDDRAGAGFERERRRRQRPRGAHGKAGRGENGGGHGQPLT